MKKIYQLKKTSWFSYDDDEKQTYHYLENDDYSEEFYTSHQKAIKALENHLKVETVWNENPYMEINLFPREHFIKRAHGKSDNREYTLTTKWEIIEIEPW